MIKKSCFLMTFRENISNKLTANDQIRSIYRTYADIKWHLEGKPIPVPYSEKHRIIRYHAKRFEINTLIETGTYFGDTVNALKSIFKEIYSIELNQELYSRSKQRFAKFSHIHIIQGDSAIILPELLSKIDKPCLFWLDAHYSEGITSKGDKVTPILEELNHILAHRIKGHAILIDDAVAFNGVGGYPHIDDLKILADKHGWVLNNESGIIRMHRE